MRMEKGMRVYGCVAAASGVLVGLMLPCDAAASEVAASQAAMPIAESFAIAEASNSMCGLHCLYAAMLYAGKQPEFRSLLKPQYIASPEGSTLAELKQAAEDHGFHAVAVARMNCTSLQQLKSPMILHVKGAADKREYDHYVLYIGTVDGKAKILDAPHPIELVPFWELGPRWDGCGLIVSADPVDVSSIMAPQRRRCAVGCVAGIAVVVVVIVATRGLRSASAVTRSGWRTLGISHIECAGLLALAGILSTGFHAMSDEGFIARPTNVIGVQRAYRSHFVPMISVATAAEKLKEPAVFVDARYPRDFARGHIPGAINIPVNSSDKKRHNTLNRVDHGKPLVVYCQSAGCRFAEETALRLLDDGFTKVSVFKGGWQEWSAKNGREQKRDTQ